MPCILKQRTETSPGIISFTSNEAVWGIATREGVRRHIDATSGSTWLYGVHIQGSFPVWPFEPWQSFVMWPEPDAPVLRTVPADRVIPLNCVNFLPDVEASGERHEKLWDICVVSRPSRIKRIAETLRLLRALLDVRPGVKVVVIVPDPRDIRLGEKSYDSQDIDRNFFDLPLRLFSARELKQITFICSSVNAFGRFPLSTDLLLETLRRSRFCLLPSHLEGTPRSLAEALVVGTPCIVSASLSSGIRHFLDDRNCVFIDDDPLEASRQVVDALDHYERYGVDTDRLRPIFCEGPNRERLRSRLATLIEAGGRPVDGEWYLDELHLRLACHGQKYNYQLMDDEAQFFEWVRLVEEVDPYDEDALIGPLGLNEAPATRLRAWLSRAKRGGRA